MKKTALITGVTGMDGSHLADFLLSKNYEVWGTIRDESSLNHRNLESSKDKLHFIKSDLKDQKSIIKCVENIKPDEIYNLASNRGAVGESWNTPEDASEVNGIGVLRILEAIRHCNKNIKFCQAGSSEMFGRAVDVPSNELSPCMPQSPYGVAKLYSYWITRNYREAYNLFVCNAILFNHNSPRRSPKFVTRKISQGVAQIKCGVKKHIVLGNLDSKRDWGYAPDYVRAMWLMTQQDTPDDYVIATNQLHSIRDFLKIAFEYIGIENWEPYVKQDSKFIRPTEVDIIQGDSSKAFNKFNWHPKISFEQMVRTMVEYDMQKLNKECGV